MVRHHQLLGGTTPVLLEPTNSRMTSERTRLLGRQSLADVELGSPERHEPIRGALESRESRKPGRVTRRTGRVSDCPYSLVEALP